MTHLENIHLIFSDVLQDAAPESNKQGYNDVDGKGSTTRGGGVSVNTFLWFSASKKDSHINIMTCSAVRSNKRGGEGTWGGIP